MLLLLSLSCSSGPLSPILHLGSPRLRTNERIPPQSIYPRHSLLSLSSSLLYYECDITLPRPFGSDIPTPSQYHLPLPFLISSPLLAIVLLNITTHCTLLPTTYLCTFPSTFTFRFFILLEAELLILFYLLLFTSTSASTLCELQCRNNIGWLVEIWFDF